MQHYHLTHLLAEDSQLGKPLRKPVPSAGAVMTVEVAGQILVLHNTQKTTHQQLDEIVELRHKTRCCYPPCGVPKMLAGAAPVTSKCQGCMVTRYCSKECQKNHWKEGHKKDCKRIQGLLSIAAEAPQQGHIKIRCGDFTSPADLKALLVPTPAGSPDAISNRHLRDGAWKARFEKACGWASLWTMPLPCFGPHSGMQWGYTLVFDDEFQKTQPRVNRVASILACQEIKGDAFLVKDTPSNFPFVERGITVEEVVEVVRWRESVEDSFLFAREVEYLHCFRDWVAENLPGKPEGIDYVSKTISEYLALSRREPESLAHAKSVQG